MLLKIRDLCLIFLIKDFVIKERKRIWSNLLHSNTMDARYEKLHHIHSDGSIDSAIYIWVYFILFYTITKFVGVNMSNTRTCSWLDNIHDISFSVLIYLYSMYDLKNTRHLGYFAGQIIWRIQKWNSSPSSSFILSRLCITIIFNFFFIE